MEKERVSIFIDGSNLYHHVKTVFGHAQIDLGRFADWLVGGRKLIRTYYYNAPVPSERDPDHPWRQPFNRTVLSGTKPDISTLR